MVETVKSLTVSQLVDILFQKPGRVTEGILEKRGVIQKFKDSTLICHDAPRAGLKNTYRNQLCLVFQRAVKIKEEHPRSLKNAALELKAFGFSPLQVNAIINKATHDFWFDYYLETYSINKLAKKFQEGIFPQGKLLFAQNENAFLGIVPYLADYAVHKNALVEPAEEDVAYEEFLGYFDALAKKEPSFLVPAAAQEQAPVQPTV